MLYCCIYSKKFFTFASQNDTQIVFRDDPADMV